LAVYPNSHLRVLREAAWFDRQQDKTGSERNASLAYDKGSDAPTSAAAILERLGRESDMGSGVAGPETRGPFGGRMLPVSLPESTWAYADDRLLRQTKVDRRIHNLGMVKEPLDSKARPKLPDIL
jgi:hypothetical protein